MQQTLIVHDFFYDKAEPFSQLAGSAIDWIAAGSDFVLTSREIGDELAVSGFRDVRMVTLPALSSSLVIARA